LISDKKKGADLNRPFFILSLKSLPNAFVLPWMGKEKKLRILFNQKHLFCLN